MVQNYQMDLILLDSHQQPFSNKRSRHHMCMQYLLTFRKMGRLFQQGNQGINLSSRLLKCLYKCQEGMVFYCIFFHQCLVVILRGSKIPQGIITRLSSKSLDSTYLFNIQCILLELHSLHRYPAHTVSKLVNQAVHNALVVLTVMFLSCSLEDNSNLPYKVQSEWEYLLLSSMSLACNRRSLKLTQHLEKDCIFRQDMMMEKLILKGSTHLQDKYPRIFFLQDQVQEILICKRILSSSSHLQQSYLFSGNTFQHHRECILRSF